MDSKGPFLFSVDVEDFPVIQDGQEIWAGGVEKLLQRYMSFLNKHKMRATFFVLGNVAERNPEIVKMILDQEHELGCHGFDHIPLTKQTKESFRKDIEKALSVFRKIGAKSVLGYRAPFLSMTPKTLWAYEVLEEFGFEYSSSVLPGYNPLFSWPGFGSLPKRQGSIWELPVTTIPGLPLSVPAAAGVYFRVMPNWLVQKVMRELKNRNAPILSYFHPYDVDIESTSRTCAWLKNNPVGNFLIFYNRKDLINRLEQLMEMDFRITTYKDYLQTL